MKYKILSEKYHYATVRMHIEDYNKIQYVSKHKHLAIATYCKVIILNVIEKYSKKGISIKKMTRLDALVYSVENKQKSKKDNEYRNLSVRLLVENYKEILKISKNHGLTLSAFVRYLILKNVEQFYKRESE